VVGFKKDPIKEAVAADAASVCDELYGQTNTGKSLLKAL
jgi:choline kinase